MRLLNDNTILLTRTERGEFFAVYDPAEKEPESRERVFFKDADAENTDWLKFAFESKAEEGSAAQKRIWSRAASLLGQVRDRLEASKRKGAVGTDG